MGKKSNLNRRDFLKKTAVGTAGLTVGLSLLKPGKANAAVTWAPGGWPAPTASPNTMQINPNINNLRVVCMYDPNMITNPAFNAWTLDGFVSSISPSVIHTDMDNMAMWLAQQTTPAAAWSTIFQKPASKTWAQVKVAIKINTCAAPRSSPRPPVIGKICNVLYGIGVPAANIVIYDGACSKLGASGGYWNYFNTTTTITLTVTPLTAAVSAGAVYTNNGNSFTVQAAAAVGATSLQVLTTGGAAPLGTSGTMTLSSGTGQASIAFSAVSGTYNGLSKYPGVISNGTGSMGGGTTSVAVPMAGNQTCPTNLANGTIDILVNIAVNKGHNSPYQNHTGQGNTGGCTLCHKNHFGTFPICHNNGAYSTTAVPVTPADITTYSNGDYSVFINMSSAIVGGTPVRQQLCIVDSIWADNNNYPDATSGPTLMPARLVMGTFAGAVDYLTCINIKNSTASQTIGGYTYSCGGPDANLDLVAGGPAASSSFPATGQVPRFLTLYGYLTTDPDLKWVAITPASVYTPSGVLPGASSGGQPHTLEVRLAGGAAMARFELPQSTAGALEIRMFDIRGRSVRKMFVELREGHTSVSWDGKNDRGRTVAPGTYEVRVLAQHYMKSGRITVE